MPKYKLTVAGLACLPVLLWPAAIGLLPSPALAIDLEEEDSTLEDSTVLVDHKAEDTDADDEEDDDEDDNEAEDEEDDDDEPIPRPVTCESAKKIVKRAGFKDVGVRTCVGKTFRLTGSRNGYNLEIIVSRSGRILGTRRR
jgi:hypothetical protein